MKKYDLLEIQYTCLSCGTKWTQPHCYEIDSLNPWCSSQCEEDFRKKSRKIKRKIGRSSRLKLILNFISLNWS